VARPPVASLDGVEDGQVVEALERVGVARAEDLAAKLDRLGEERLGLAVASLACVERGQVVEARKRLGMVFAKGQTS